MDTPPPSESGTPEPVATYPPKPEPEPLERTFLISQFLLSLLVFGAAWYFLISRNLELITWLVIILIIHELGHFLAMKFF